MPRLWKEGHKNKNMTSQRLERQKCEIYSRVVGYLSPVQRWNAGKQSEYKDRKEYNSSFNSLTDSIN
jgi:anaerobic ribonucleoside-triphosphate reductase